MSDIAENLEEWSQILIDLIDKHYVDIEFVEHPNWENADVNKWLTVREARSHLEKIVRMLSEMCEAMRQHDASEEAIANGKEAIAKGTKMITVVTRAEHKIVTSIEERPDVDTVA